MTNKKIVEKLLEIIKKYCIFKTSNIAFYYDGKITHNKNSNKKLITENFNASDYIDDYGIDYCIYMTFEGDFYEVINNGYEDDCHDEFIKFLEQNNMYYELCGYWSMFIIKEAKK